MNYFRTFISKKKKHFIDRKYNLDLSYITPRIIVMSYPTSFPQSFFLNNIKEVASFLNERHGNNYLLINLIDKKNDNSKFNGEVLEYIIEYNMPLYIQTLFDICFQIDDYLKKNLSSVVIINCKGGKGRVGTVVCCYLLFIKKFIEIKDAIDYYSLKRLYKGKGIDQPSQKRYIEYFYKIISRKKIFFPLRIKLTSIELKNMDEVYDNGKYVLEIWDMKNNKFMNIDFNPDNYKVNYIDKSVILEVGNIIPQELYGDIVFTISYNLFNDLFFTQKLGKISFNTAFLNIFQDQIKFKSNEIDPYNLLKYKKIPEDYEIIVNFEIQCNICQSKEIKDFCDDCKNFIKENMYLYNNWRIVMDYWNRYKEKKIEYDKNILFGVIDDDDSDYILKIEDKKAEKNVNKEENKIDINVENDRNSSDENNESYSSDYSEGEDYEDKYIANEDINKKNKSNDSFESECFIF